MSDGKRSRADREAQTQRDLERVSSTQLLGLLLSALLVIEKLPTTQREWEGRKGALKEARWIVTEMMRRDRQERLF